MTVAVRAPNRVYGKAKLSRAESMRLVGLERLVAQVRIMVKESGNLDGFDPAKWLAQWLNEPVGALGGKKPADYMGTSKGQEIISNLLLQVQFGVYA